MKPTNIIINLAGAVALALLLPACATTQTTTTTSTMASGNQVIAELANVGFKPFSTKTERQQRYVASLPPDKITRVKRGAVYMWVYPDAANHQVYVGGQRAYQAFRAERKAKTGMDSDEDMVRSFDTKRGVPVQIYDGFVPMNAMD